MGHHTACTSHIITNRNPGIERNDPLYSIYSRTWPIDPLYVRGCYQMLSGSCSKASFVHACIHTLFCFSLYIELHAYDWCLWREKKRINKDRKWSGVVQIQHGGMREHAGTPSYLPHIWAGYKGSQTTRTYENNLRGSVVWLLSFYLLSGHCLGRLPRRIWGKLRGGRGSDCRCSQIAGIW